MTGPKSYYKIDVPPGTPELNASLTLAEVLELYETVAEIDARGHNAPMAREFRKTMREHGVKFAFQKRDAAFGRGFAAVEGPDPE